MLEGQVDGNADEGRREDDGADLGLKGGLVPRVGGEGDARGVAWIDRVSKFPRGSVGFVLEKRPAPGGPGAVRLPKRPIRYPRWIISEENSHQNNISPATIVQLFHPITPPIDTCKKKAPTSHLKRTPSDDEAHIGPCFPPYPKAQRDESGHTKSHRNEYIQWRIRIVPQGRCFNGTRRRHLQTSI